MDTVSRSQKSKTIGRENASGRFVSVSEAKRRPTTTEKERIPLPGQSSREHATKTSADRDIRYRDSTSGQFVPERDRHPSKSSADRIRSTSEKASDSLKRLAKR